MSARKTMNKWRFFKIVLIAVVLIAVGLYLSNVRTPKKEGYKMSDPTMNRILYQVELDENKDAPRHTQQVSTRAGCLQYMTIGGYYRENWKFDETKLYENMSAFVIPLADEDGNVQTYLLYCLYDRDLRTFFGALCDKGTTTTTITWFMDKRGNRVIEFFDQQLVMASYIAAWKEVNEEYGNIPPIDEANLSLSGTYPAYEPCQNDDILKLVEKQYPNVIPYGEGS